jgi:hypothetical protein
MKYMILAYGSQQDYDAMAGKATPKAAWSGQDFAAHGRFHGKVHQGPHAVGGTR